MILTHANNDTMLLDPTRHSYLKCHCIKLVLQRPYQHKVPDRHLRVDRQQTQEALMTVMAS